MSDMLLLTGIKLYQRCCAQLHRSVGALLMKVTVFSEELKKIGRKLKIIALVI